jgi:hypothetical protein
MTKASVALTYHSDFILNTKDPSLVVEYIVHVGILSQDSNHLLNLILNWSHLEHLVLTIESIVSIVTIATHSNLRPMQTMLVVRVSHSITMT